eukprot:c12660_g1_i2.p1 GENE.c12660_g1_i2~~c12660_g1_i2.p1  ORF type:complete len:271 (+),score=5.84 c12660_g1_i2:39-851(+)
MDDPLRENQRAGVYKKIEKALNFNRSSKEGEIANGERFQTFTDGTKYWGQMKDNMFSGLGVLEFQNGDTYIGQFANDMPEGYGVMFLVRYGDRYEGQFHQGKRNGVGAFYRGNGEKFEGVFFNNLRHEHGCYTFRNGDEYRGEYKLGHEQGKALYISKDRKDQGLDPYMQAGEWKKGLEKQYPKGRPSPSDSSFGKVAQKVDKVVSDAQLAAKKAVEEGEKAEAIKIKLVSDIPVAKEAALRSKANGGMLSTTLGGGAGMPSGLASATSV